MATDQDAGNVITYSIEAGNLNNKNSENVENVENI